MWSYWNGVDNCEIESVGLINGVVDVLVHWYIVKSCSAKDVGGRVTDRANCEVT